MSYRWMIVIMIAIGVVGVAVHSKTTAAKEDKKAESRVFEMRTYFAASGKMKALNARFRDHTIKLFEKHGIKNIGYWQPVDEKEAEVKLIYIVAHPSMEEAKKNWKSFIDDPDWKKVKADTEKDGKLVDKIESVYLNPTDYSQIK